MNANILLKAIKTISIPTLEIMASKEVVDISLERMGYLSSKMMPIIIATIGIASIAKSIIGVNESMKVSKWI